MVSVAHTAVPADVLHVLDNVRDVDREEIAACSSTGEFEHAAMYAAVMMSGERHNYTLLADDGEPIGLFGLVETQYDTPIAWAFGTDRFSEGVPQMTKIIRRVIVPDLIRRGIPVVTCFSLTEREDSANLIKMIGGKVHAVTQGVGCQRELTQWIWESGQPDHSAARH